MSYGAMTESNDKSENEQLDSDDEPEHEQQELLKFPAQGYVYSESRDRIYPIIMISGVTGYIKQQDIQDAEESQQTTQPDEFEPTKSAWHVLDRLASCTIHLLTLKDR